MRPFGVEVSMIEPGNYIAGTNIFNENFVKGQAEKMWGEMTEEVKRLIVEIKSNEFEMWRTLDMLDHKLFNYNNDFYGQKRVTNSWNFLCYLI